MNCTFYKHKYYFSFRFNRFFMCGITGIMAFNEVGRMHMIHLAQATDQLKHRGPDYQNTYIEERVGLGHRRLVVIDPSPQAHQPMSDPSGRYTVVYNGEIYNYRHLRQKLQNQGVEFTSQSDTEVLLQMYIHHGTSSLDHLNGCFALAIYDSHKKELFLARDRLGINPLLVYHDEDKMVFSSEMKSLLCYHIPKSLDYESLSLYLQLNYLPGPFTLLQGVKKLLPGEYMVVSSQGINTYGYYDIPLPMQTPDSLSYKDQQSKLQALLEEAVVKRLVSDVPLGAFLSGGIDSSVVVALASKHVKDLNTFSIGYKDHPFYDETKYAQLVASKFGTRHSVFSLSNQDLYQHLFEMWDHLDEPFGDSSALPTYILSKYTSQTVTVALSGDGADELFGGYHKHLALQMSIERKWPLLAAALLSPLTGILPKSRNNIFSNKVRQLDRLAKGRSLPLADRYWLWASISTHEQVISLLSSQSLQALNQPAVEGRRQLLIKHLKPGSSINEVLYTDQKMVLPYDMLTKVDWMSMAHGLEVRVPFCDHELVNFASSLPAESKVHGRMSKRILQDTFKDLLPGELYGRPKKGFEVPLLDWMRNELQGVIENELLHDSLVVEQGIFNPVTVKMLKKKLRGGDPHDTASRIWGLLVFQNWWKKYFQ